jgi:ABC transporter substrate binding protein
VGRASHSTGSFEAGFANFGKPLADAEIHAAVPLCVHHSLEGEHVHALRSRERGCFLVCRLYGRKKFSPSIFAVLGDVNYRAFEAGLPAVETASRALERQMVVVKISSEHEFEGAFAEIAQAGAGALLVSGSPFFTSQRRALVALAARHAIPAIYDQRDIVVDGGLMSYSASFTGAYRQAGTYVGKILKGAKPSELPVLQPTTFELVLNLKSARTLGIDVPPMLIARADEVIE